MIIAPAAEGVVLTCFWICNYGEYKGALHPKSRECCRRMGPHATGVFLLVGRAFSEEPFFDILHTTIWCEHGEYVATAYFRPIPNMVNYTW